MSVVIELWIIILVSIVIYVAGNIFAESSSQIGDYFKLSRSVKGATFDAIASSLPELFVALYAVIVFKQFEIGIGTITGSALFNILVIPGLCILISPIIPKVSKEVIARDALFYVISASILLGLTLFVKIWGLIVSGVLLVTYIFYVMIIVRDTRRRHRIRTTITEPRQITIIRHITIAAITMIIIGGASYLLVRSSVNLSNSLNVPAIIIALTITAAATSVPDAVISIANAKKGSWDDAMSNVYGSNSFDILIGLGLPLLIYNFYKGPVEIRFGNLEIIAGLLGSTIIVLFLFWKGYKLTKNTGLILLGMYSVFVGYTIFLSVKT